MKDWRKHRPKALIGLLILLAFMFVLGVVEKNMGHVNSQGVTPQKSDEQIIREQADRLDKATHP